jgi:SAM-dependent methyltransferase
MADHDAYFDYLKRRSRVGGLYRHYWLYPRLARRLRGRALDVGCGIGDMLLHRPETIGVDVNPRTVEFCRLRGAQANLMQPDDLPFEAGSFDSVLMDNVLEHIALPEPLLREVHRVLRPGGDLLIGVPGHRGWDSDADHKVFYDEASLLACVQPMGFRHAETFHAPLWRSAWFDHHLRQYCVYGLFIRG